MRMRTRGLRGSGGNPGGNGRAAGSGDSQLTDTAGGVFIENLPGGLAVMSDVHRPYLQLRSLSEQPIERTVTEFTSWRGTRSHLLGVVRVHVCRGKERAGHTCTWRSLVSGVTVEKCRQAIGNRFASSAVMHCGRTPIRSF